MSAAKRAAQLSHWVEDSVARIRQTAASAPRGGDDRWIGLLTEFGVEPLGPEERTRHLEQGAPINKGALPMEFRWALEAIESRAAPACREIDLAVEVGDDATQREVDKLAQRINLVVSDELTAYMSSIRPTVTTSSIFANALASSPNYMAQSDGAGVSTTACGACGAPRQAGRESMTCEFCGSNLA